MPDIVASPAGRSLERDEPSTDAIALSAAGRLQIHAQVDRILADPLFLNSDRFKKLLRYIVERTVNNDEGPLKERTIGFEIFRKALDYDTSTDPTVRVAVADLRKRLALYYRDPEHKHELRISVPQRSYMLEVHAAEQPAPRAPDTIEPPAVIAAKPYWRQSWWVAAAVAISILLGSLLAVRALSTSWAVDPFWSPLVSGTETPAIVVGSRYWTAPEVQAHPDGTPSNPSSSEDAQARNLEPSFPMNDLTAANAITSYLGRHGKDTDLRLAQSTSLSDLRKQPFVLIGGFRNDWFDRLEGSLRFRLKQTGENGEAWIEDSTRPTDMTWRVDMSQHLQRADREYVLVTRVFDRSVGEWWIGLAGTTGVGTQAAQQLVTDPKAMHAIEERFDRGWENKNLEIVVEIQLVNRSPGSPRVLAVSSW